MLHRKIGITIAHCCQILTARIGVNSDSIEAWLWGRLRRSRHPATILGSQPAIFRAVVTGCHPFFAAPIITGTIGGV
jgi:hypothetical protein